MKKLIYILIGIGISTAAIVYAAPNANIFRHIYPETNSTYYLGSSTPQNAWKEGTFVSLCLTGDSCLQTWPTGGGGGGSDVWASSTGANGLVVKNIFGNAVGINSTTPWATLVVEGKSGSTTPILVVASSTHAAILTVTSAGNVNLSSTSATSLLGTDASKNLQSLTITNDTNITGAVTNSALVLGWTGTLTAARLNSNVVQSVTTTTVNNLLNATVAAQVLALTFPTNLVNNVSTGTAGNNINVSTSTTGSTNALVINVPDASATSRGALTSTDWFTFNNKVATTRQILTSAPITGGGDLSADRTIACNTASIAQAGCLAAADFLIFNNKLSGSAAVNQVTYFTGATTTAGSANFLWDNTARALLINTTTVAQANFQVTGTSTINDIFRVSSSTGLTFLSVGPLGSTTAISLNVSNLISGKCVQASTNGLLTTVAAACGSGGASTPGGLNTQLQFNENGAFAGSIFTYSSTTPGFGISSATPNATLVVQGSSSNPTLDIFRTASSSGDTFLSVSNMGSTTAKTLTGLNLVSGNCLQATTGGMIVSVAAACGSGGSGNSAWTLKLGFIHNATSTDSVVIGSAATTTSTTLQITGRATNNLFTINSSTDAEILRVTPAGRLAINSSTPNATLVVQGTTSDPSLDIFRVATSANQTYLSVTNAGKVLVANGSNLNPGLAFQGQTGVGFALSGTSIEIDAGGNKIGLFTSTQLQLRNNGAAAPEFSSLTNTNSGMNIGGTGATGNIGFSTNGVERFTLKNPGFNGFNSTTPNATLVVQGYSGSTTPTFAVASSSMDVQFLISAIGNVNISTTTASQLLGTDVNKNVVSYGVGTGTTGTDFNVITSTPNQLLFNLPTSGIGIRGLLSGANWTTFNDKLSGSAAVNQVTYFTGATTTAGSANFLWDNTARALLLNTTTPAQANFQVTASTTQQGNDIFRTSSSSGATFLVVKGTGRTGVNTDTPISTLAVRGLVGSMPFSVASSTGKVHFEVNQDGTVGVNTDTPASTLAVQALAGQTTDCFSVASSTGNPAFRVNCGVPTASVWAVNSSTNITMFTANIDSTFGVNTTTLGLANMFVQGTSVQPTLKIFTAASSSGANYLTVLANGIVGINTNTPITYGFVVATTTQLAKIPTSGSNQTYYICADANLQLIADTTTCLVSSKRFKKNIYNLNAGLDEVLQLRPVSYFKKEPLGPSDANEQIGFIAEEAQVVDPRLVEIGSDGLPKSFRYEQFTALLTKAVQELNTKVDNVKGVARKAEENWQWLVMGLMLLWIIRLELKK